MRTSYKNILPQPLKGSCYIPASEVVKMFTSSNLPSKIFSYSIRGTTMFSMINMKRTQKRSINGEETRISRNTSLKSIKAGILIQYTNTIWGCIDIIEKAFVDKRLTSHEFIPFLFTWKYFIHLDHQSVALVSTTSTTSNGW